MQGLLVNVNTKYRLFARAPIFHVSAHEFWKAQSWKSTRQDCVGAGWGGVLAHLPNWSC